MMMRRVLHKYDELLRTRPLLTKSITSGVIAGLGDVGAQLVVEKGDFDLARNMRFTLLGGALVGPSLHVWYGALGRYIPGNSIRDVLKRIAFDQFAFSPVFIGLFFNSIGFLEGKSGSEMQSKLGEIWLPTVVRNWVFWVPVQAVNFRLVPPQYQVLWANGAGLIWNTYLSYVSQRKGPS